MVFLEEKNHQTHTLMKHRQSHIENLMVKVRLKACAVLFCVTIQRLLPIFLVYKNILVSFRI